MSETERPKRDWDLDQLRDWLRPRLERPDGVKCPVCTQHAQAYKRVITKAMVATMRLMLEAAVENGSPHSWIKLADIPQKTRDTATLQYWGLITEHGEKRGWWQIGTSGQLFLQGTYRVEKYAHVYNGECYAHSGPYVGVTTVDPHFDYGVVTGLLDQAKGDDDE